MLEPHRERGDASEKKVRVLLVEDDPTNRFVTVAKLTKRGYNVAVAENGQVACEKLYREIFDVVLMDVSMPIMDGFEATTKIRSSSEPFSTVPIIGLTAHGHDEVRQRCFKTGMDDFLCKPVQGDVICAAIDRVLGARKS